MNSSARRSEACGRPAGRVRRRDLLRFVAVATRRLAGAAVGVAPTTTTSRRSSPTCRLSRWWRCISRNGSTAAPTARRACCARASLQGRDPRHRRSARRHDAAARAHRLRRGGAARRPVAGGRRARPLLLPRRPLPGRRIETSLDSAPRGPGRADERRQRRLRRRRPGPGRPDHRARRAAPAQAPTWCCSMRSPTRHCARWRRSARWIDVGKRGFTGVRTRRSGGRENTGQDTINALLVKHALRRPARRAPQGRRPEHLRPARGRARGARRRGHRVRGRARRHRGARRRGGDAAAAHAPRQRPQRRPHDGDDARRRPRRRPPRRHRGRSTWPASSSPPCRAACSPPAGRRTRR